MTMPLYTFVAEHNGATELEQIEARGVDEATRAWNLRTGTPRIDPARFELDPPAAVTGLQRVWCFSGLDTSEDLYLVHVIRTGLD